MFRGKIYNVRALIVAGLLDIRKHSHQTSDHEQGESTLKRNFRSQNLDLWSAEYPWWLRTSVANFHAWATTSARD